MENFTRIIINVTQEDINKGKRNDWSKCPIALAVERELKHPVSVGVLATVRLESDPECNNIMWLADSQKATNFVKKFDAGLDKVYPTTFYLTCVPKELIKYCEE